ncbi:MAG: UbiH/UbiF family hydroxylase [Pseudomonadota bacterium]
MRTETDILIAGGGPAGLIATLAFAAQGRRALCVDAAPPVTEEGAEGSDLRSTALLMPAIRLLEEAGVWEKLAPHAAPLRVMRIIDAGGRENRARRSRDFVAEDVGESLFGYNVMNWQLRRSLVEAIEASSATLRAPAAVSSVAPRSAEALVTLADGDQVAARLAVAADGRDSTLRRLHGIDARTFRYGQKALVFAVAHDMPHDGVSTEIHRTGGPFTLVPLPDREGVPHSAIVWMERGAEAERLMALDEPAFAAEVTARSLGVLGALRPTGPRRIWPIITRHARRMIAPRTALIAEAAHVMPPIGAQGLNTSLGDLRALLDLTAGAEDPGAPELLARYARARIPDIALRLGGIDLLNRAAMAEAQPLRDVRGLGLALLHDLSPIRRTAMRLGLGTAR